MPRRLLHPGASGRGRPRRSTEFFAAALLALAVGVALLGAQATVPALAKVSQAAVSPVQAGVLPAAERIAAGVDLFVLSDPDLLVPPGPIAVQALRLDPRRVDLGMAQADDGVAAKATVAQIASRNGALAAVNGGFFNVGTGRPTGLLKVGGRLVSSGSLPRAAVAIIGRSWRKELRLAFDQVSVARPPGPGGAPVYSTRLGTSPKVWEKARHAVAGAGLLVRSGRDLLAEDRAPERLADAFSAARHPRTVIGCDPKGFIWLVTIDGRNPSLSLGMTFVELQRLAHRLGLSDALNLDGGGSTTMVVKGEVVNHPSDATGPRLVSDAILVFLREP